MTARAADGGKEFSSLIDKRRVDGEGVLVPGVLRFRLLVELGLGRGDKRGERLATESTPLDFHVESRLAAALKEIDRDSMDALRQLD